MDLKNGVLVFAVLIVWLRLVMSFDEINKYGQPGLLRLCGDNFIQAYEYCCMNYKQCQEVDISYSWKKRSILKYHFTLKGNELISRRN